MISLNYIKKKIIFHHEKHYDKSYPKMMNVVHFPNYFRRIPFYTPPHTRLKNYFFQIFIKFPLIFLTISMQNL